MTIFLIIGATGGCLFLIALTALIGWMWAMGLFSDPAASSQSGNGKCASDTEAVERQEVQS